jgi:hypothetical protein
MPVAVDTSGRIYDVISRLLFLCTPLVNEMPEESGQFRFLRAASLTNIKGSVGLIVTKAWAMRITMPLDLSPGPFIPLLRFIRSKNPTTLLAPSIVFPPFRFA